MKIILYALSLLALVGCEAGPGVSSRLDSDPTANTFSIGEITPSIYFHPVFKEATGNISDQLTSLVNREGKTLVTVSTSQAILCETQRSCSIIYANQFIRHLDFDLQKQTATYVEYQPQRCPYGLGERGYCLDPFFSVAADRNIYVVGSVLFIPTLKGLNLPTGEVHDGYVIVRDHLDQGNARRFSFFTGFYSLNHPENTFVTHGLGDSNTQVDFMTVKDNKLIQSIYQKRGYPNLASLVLERGLRELQAMSNQ